ncbi:hypothetical protein RND71_027414 [Anisodus tanguticus]|uniref:Uncharacterized protein n=1 Tax=Anisodus tanguticus TaxID=243964 RepID=A0AAE1V666_9SOLA|nr:hypothetical protein RND71_027414 [Anisodus tanguticus]
MAVEGRNQKALGDIGNLATGHVVVGNHFFKELLNLIVNVKGANVAKVPKPAQKKATVKPKPEEIITSPILLAMKDAVGAAIRRKGVNL